MKNSFLCFITLITIAAALSAASAHIPELVLDNKNYSEQPVIVDEPEISFAYYGQMGGQPHIYKIEMKRPGNLYVNLLAPYDGKSNITPVTEFILFNETGVIAEFSNITNWTPFYEEYGGNWYLKGPEVDINVTEGDYYVNVSSPTNTDMYVLAIGKIERFGAVEILKTAFMLPEIKAIFFEDYTLMIIYMIISVAILCVIGFFVWKKRNK